MYLVIGQFCNLKSQRSGLGFKLPNYKVPNYQFNPMDLNNKRVLVVGLGKSGVASALFLKSHGARVTVSDSKPEVMATARFVDRT